MAKNKIREKLDSLSQTILSGTLAAGSTSITLYNSAITTESLIDIYTDNYSIAPIGATVNSGEIILSFDAQTSAVKIKIIVR